MKILLLGSGGREHALAWKISKSEKCEKLFIAPGNAGTSDVGENVAIGVNDFERIKAFAIDNAIDMIVVGPEDPLVNGIYDCIKSDPATAHIVVIGPTKAGAQLEGSKDFAKAFMQRHRIPTARYQTFDGEHLQEGLQFLETLNPPYVLKADGLCAGQGVLILPTLDEAKKELEAKVEEAKQKIAELMASTDTMKVRIADYEQQIADKDAEIEEKNAEIEELKDKVTDAETKAQQAEAKAQQAENSGSQQAFDMGQIFVQAQQTANLAIEKARADAKQITDEAEAQANQAIDDANAQAEATVTKANAEAEQTLSSAKESAENTRAEAKREADQVTGAAYAEANKVKKEAEEEAERVIADAKSKAAAIKNDTVEIRTAVKEQFTTLSDTVQKLVTSLNDLYGSSIGAVNTARDLIDDGLDIVSEGEEE